MTRWRLIVGVLVLTAGLGACAKDKTPAAPTPPPAPAPVPPPPPPPPSPTTAAFSGTVSNITGARVAGARVTALDGPNAGLSITTNAIGEFRFPGLTIANTNFSATGGGYREVRGGAYVDGNSTLNFVFTHASLTGTVSNSDGDRVGGATIMALDGPNAGQSTMADGGGVYRFEALNIANGNFVAMAERHEDDRRGTFINGTNTLDFNLTRLPDEVSEAPPVVPAITIVTRIITGGGGSPNQEWEVEAVGNVEFSPEQYEWRYGDGSGTTSRRVERHIYRKGNYTVMVTGVVEGTGQKVEASLDIRVE